MTPLKQALRCGMLLPRTRVLRAGVRGVAAAPEPAPGGEPQRAAPPTRARTRLLPPGAGASAQARNKFSAHVSDVLRAGDLVECRATGPSAVRKVLGALAGASRSAEFEVRWDGFGVDAPTDRSLLFLARRGAPWDEYMQTPFREIRSFFVGEDTDTLKLATAVVAYFKEAPDDALRLHAHADEESACHVLVKAMATVPAVHGSASLPLLGVPNLLKMPDGRRRLFVCTRLGTRTEDQDADTSAVAFTTRAPGPSADLEVLKAFTAAVHDRLRLAELVEISCRGADSVARAMRVLCEFQGNVARFEVDWQGGGQGANPPVHSLRVRARQGESWADFNKLKHSDFRLLFCNSDTDVKALAKSLAVQVQDRRAVSLHTYSDNKVAMNIAIKALATAPRVARLPRVYAVPSFGYAKGRQGSQPVLRLFIRARSPPAGDE